MGPSDRAGQVGHQGSLELGDWGGAARSAAPLSLKYWPDRGWSLVLLGKDPRSLLSVCHVLTVQTHLSLPGRSQQAHEARSAEQCDPYLLQVSRGGMGPAFLCSLSHDTCVLPQQIEPQRVQVISWGPAEALLRASVEDRNGNNQI